MGSVADRGSSVVVTNEIYCPMDIQSLLFRQEVAVCWSVRDVLFLPFSEEGSIPDCYYPFLFQLSQDWQDRGRDWPKLPLDVPDVSDRFPPVVEREEIGKPKNWQ